MIEAYFITLELSFEYIIVLTQCVSIGRVPHGGWRSKPVISKSDAIGIGFHNTDRLVAVEPSPVARRRQHRARELKPKLYIIIT